MILKFQCWYLYHISNVGTLLKDTNKKPVKFQQNPNVSPMLVCLIFFPFVNSQLNSVSTSPRRHLYIRISWYFNKTPLLGVFIFLKKKKMIKQIYPASLEWKQLTVVMTTLLKSKKSLWWVLTNCKPASQPVMRVIMSAMLVPSPFSFLRLLAIWHKFSLSSLSFQYCFVICLHLFHLLLR